MKLNQNTPALAPLSMTLKELKIGDKFRLTKKGIDWVKETEQGIDNYASYIKTVNKYNTRCMRMSHRNKFVKQSVTVFPVIDCPDCSVSMVLETEMNTDRYGNLKYYNCTRCKEKWVSQDGGELKIAAA